jgi:hypothetical protein
MLRDHFRVQASHKIGFPIMMQPVRQQPVEQALHRRIRSRMPQGQRRRPELAQRPRGGTIRYAKKALSSRGASAMKSPKKRNASAAFSSGYNTGPAYTVLTGCSRNSSDVITPKLPPPPRIAQNRSAFSASLEQHPPVSRDHVGRHQVVAR